VAEVYGPLPTAGPIRTRVRPAFEPDAARGVVFVDNFPGVTRRRGTAVMETNARYSGLSVLNHWIAAIGIFVMLTLGLAAGEADSDAVEHYVVSVHVALGFFVLLFVLWRIGWRLYEGFHVDPRSDALTRYLGGATHRALLVALAIIVVTGPLYLFTEGEGIDVFGWFTFYLPLEGLAFLHEPAGAVHKTMAGQILPVLLVLHVAGGIRHYLTRPRAASHG